MRSERTFGSGFPTCFASARQQEGAEAIAFTEMILRLGRTPRDQLRAYTL